MWGTGSQGGDQERKDRRMGRREGKRKEREGENQDRIQDMDRIRPASGASALCRPCLHSAHTLTYTSKLKTVKRAVLSIQESRPFHRDVHQGPSPQTHALFNTVAWKWPAQDPRAQDGSLACVEATGTKDSDLSPQVLL